MTGRTRLLLPWLTLIVVTLAAVLIVGSLGLAHTWVATAAPIGSGMLSSMLVERWLKQLDRDQRR
jgi:hypothetical protein